MSVQKPRNRALLSTVDSGRFLHIGCVGDPDVKHDWLHGLLSNRVDELVGIDINRRGVERLVQDGYDVRLDDATELETVSGPFDTVVAPEVIEHLSEPGELFDAVKDVLGPSGRLFITTPNPWAACYLRRVAVGEDPVGNEEHTCWIDATTLEELADRHGWVGDIQHLPPMSGGLTALFWRLGHTRLGSTRIMGNFRLGDDL